LARNSWRRTGIIGQKRSGSASLSSETVFDYDVKEARATQIENEMAAADFWSSQERAQETIGRLKALRAIVKPVSEVIKAAGDLPTMLELAEEDEAYAAEVRAEIERLEKALDALELKALLNGPHDSH